MKGCTLCDLPARVYCESDRASLCWDCDAKVHGANFLVARHSRSLLCRSCRCLTVWKASGPRLGPTVSICDRCSRGVKVEDVRDDDEDADVAEGDIEDEGSEEDAESGEEVEDAENQVVPWGMEMTTMEMTPPVASCSSSSTDDSDSSTSAVRNRNPDANRKAFVKRRRQDLDLNISPQDDLPLMNCSPPNFFHYTSAMSQPPRHVEAASARNLSHLAFQGKEKGSFSSVSHCTDASQLPKQTPIAQAFLLSESSVGHNMLM